MRPTTPGIFLLLAVLAALAAPVAALGQAQDPSALWEAYPLDQASTAPAPATVAPPAAETPVPAEPPAAAPEPSGDDGIPLWAIIAGALAVVVVGGGIAIFTVARLRQYRQPGNAALSSAAPEEVDARAPSPVAEPVAVAPAPARTPEPVVRTAPPDPTPAAAPAPAAPARAPAPAPRPEPVPVVATAAADAALADDLELAELAAEYLWTVATGSRRPVVDLAGRRNLRVGRARELLSRARARGILTGAGRGRPGGALTEKGRRLLEAGSHATGAALPEGAPPPAAATPEAAPAGPPRLRLADEKGGSSGPPANGADLMEGDGAREFTVLEGGARKLS